MNGVALKFTPDAPGGMLPASRQFLPDRRDLCRFASSGPAFSA
jgi:hypothetical protein